MSRITALLHVTMLLAGAAIGLPASATDQSRPVPDVIAVDVNGDLDGFLERMQRIEAIARRRVISGIRGGQKY